MALTFPRDMPEFRSMRSEFRPRYFQSRNVSGGGVPQVTQVAPPLWQGQWEVETQGRVLTGEWEAWLESLRGGLRTFKATPPKRRWPVTYPRGFTGLLVSGSPFSGSGNLSVIGAGRDTVTVNQLPIGFVLQPGDFFSIPVGSRQHLHRILEGGTASGAGEVTLTVEPTIRPNATTTVAVKFADPFCEMVLAADWRVSKTGNDAAISFSGLQVLF